MVFTKYFTRLKTTVSPTVLFINIFPKGDTGDRQTTDFDSHSISPKGIPMKNNPALVKNNDPSDILLDNLYTSN